MKTKKAMLAIAGVMLTGVMALSLAGCEWFSFGRKNKTDVSDSLEYPSGVGGWLTSGETSHSSDYQRYLDYLELTGQTQDQCSFLDFLRALNDDSASLTAGLRASVAIVNNAGSGSGVIYRLEEDEDVMTAYVVTNYHVVYSGSKFAQDSSVFLYGSHYPYESSIIDATFVGGAKEEDLAVLKMEIPEASKDFVQSIEEHVGTRNSDIVRAGEKVYAIGNTKGEGITVLAGIVGVTAEDYNVSSTVKTVRMRIDAAVNHGNSGGGLFDKDGNFIGIVDGGKDVQVSGDETVPLAGFGHAIPGNRVTSVVQSILDNVANEEKSAWRGLLGTLKTASSMGEYDSTLEAINIVEKVRVDEIAQYSPFKTYEEELKGNYITKIEAYDTAHGGAQKINVDILRRHQALTVLYNIRSGYLVRITYVNATTGEEGSVEATYSESKHFEKVTGRV